MVCTNNLCHITDRAHQLSVTSYYGDTTLLKPQQYFLLLTRSEVQKTNNWDIQLQDMSDWFLYVFSVCAYTHDMHLFSKSSKQECKTVPSGHSVPLYPGVLGQADKTHQKTQWLCSFSIPNNR